MSEEAPAAPRPDAEPGPGPYPQSAFAYPAAPTEPPRRSWGKRAVLLVVGAAVIVSALLFGGGFWAGSALSSVPGTSFDHSGDDPRMGPGGPGGQRFPGRDDTDTDSDTQTDSTDPTIFEG